MEQFYKALYMQFTAEKEKAIATLQLYVNNPTQIADHACLVDEVCVWINKLAEADSRLETLEKYFRMSESSPDQPIELEQD